MNAQTWSIALIITYAILTLYLSTAIMARVERLRHIINAKIVSLLIVAVTLIAYLVEVVSRFAHA